MAKSLIARKANEEDVSPTESDKVVLGTTPATEEVKRLPVVLPEPAQPDPREVLSNVIGYLHENGLGDVGHAVFNYVLPRLAGSIGATGVATNKIDGGDVYKNMSDAPIADLATQTKDAFSPEDNIDTSSTSDIADRATSGLEAPTVDVSDSPATTPAKNVSPSPTRLKTVSNEPPMSDEDIHAWNLAHNPNYDPNVFDEHTGTFNYNKGNQ